MVLDSFKGTDWIINVYTSPYFKKKILHNNAQRNVYFNWNFLFEEAGRFVPKFTHVISPYCQPFCTNIECEYYLHYVRSRVTMHKINTGIGNSTIMTLNHVCQNWHVFKKYVWCLPSAKAKHEGWTTDKVIPLWHIALLMPQEWWLSYWETNYHHIWNRQITSLCQRVSKPPCVNIGTLIWNQCY